jgi:hypothetical protein
MKNRIAIFTVTIGLFFAAAVRADNDVREAQTKLSDEGLYFGQVDGDYSTDLSAALTRYQVRKGLPITGQLDVETSKALGVKPSVSVSSPNDRRQTSETWQRLRKSDKHFPGKTVWRAPSPSANETGVNTGTPRSAAEATVPDTQSAESSPEESSSPGMPVFSGKGELASSPPTTIVSSPASDISERRLRDYVGGFVLAGLDPKVGAEAAFFADRVQYYNEGIKDREKIREDLKRYDSRWPGRKFWVAGRITVEPQTDKRIRVTFPLRYELRNGAKRSFGKVDKTLVLERAGEDLQIVAVNESKAE